MLAETATELPVGRQWIYEPKYDGFRCIVVASAGDNRLLSKTMKPLQRFFPDLVTALSALPAREFILDAEIRSPVSFEDLQIRLHPAASRIARLAIERPAYLTAFDMLADTDGRNLMGEPFAVRRRALKAFLAGPGKSPLIKAAKSTRSVEVARKWLSEVGTAIEGIMAKRLDLAYQPGRRGPAMLKFKTWNTVDCVVGGFTYAEPSRVVDALLLGLYDDEGALHYVGNARVTRDGEAFGRLLSDLKSPSAFTGRRPGSRNRWTGAVRNPVYIRPQLVAEVSSERVTANYFRHGARLMRWRSDKRPMECKLDQMKVLSEENGD